jgi:hypothetical protein
LNPEVFWTAKNYLEVPGLANVVVTAWGFQTYITGIGFVHMCFYADLISLWCSSIDVHATFSWQFHLFYAT